MHRQLRAAGTFLGAAVLACAAWVPPSAGAGLRFRAIPDPAVLASAHPDQTLGLPASWRFPMLRSGLESPGQPTIAVSVDPLTGLVRESYREGTVDVRDPLVLSGSEYATLLSARTARRLWGEKSRSTRSVMRSGIVRGPGILSVELPVRMPKLLTKVLGDGAPRLDVSGSETITISGKSDWTVGQSEYTGERQRQGAFPSFEMKQELNVNLTGSIGDKIKVDVDQSSNVQTSLDNKVKLRYEGDEDDMIKTVELGNTNLSLTGAGIRQDGLFGIKTAAKLGNLDVVAIASKQESKNETARFTPSGEQTPVQIRDLDYVKRQYFFLADRPVLIDSLFVWRDFGRANETENAPGLARLDPTAPADSAANPEIEGKWKQLTPDTDFSITDTYWEPDIGVDGRIPVLRLTAPLQEHEMLAVTYVDRTSGTRVRVGDPGTEANPGLGKPAGVSLLKLLRPVSDKLKANAEGYYDPSLPFFPTLRYELRNFYDLGARNISLSNISLAVRRFSHGEATHPDRIEDDPRPLLEILGLDQLGAQGEPGPDGKIDDKYVIADKGILFFPDLNPFDPTGYAQGGCPPGRTGFICLNDTLRNSLRRSKATANEIVYYRQKPDPIGDSRYFIDALLQSSRQGFFLGRFNILEGSEQVKVNNLPMIRGTHYNIDYGLGQLTFMQLPGPDDVITVDYSFAPGFAQVQRSLLGFSASYNPASNIAFSSSMLYETKGAQEENVKLGEEPAKSMLGDFSTVLSFQPVWMTQLVNGLPGIQTSRPSRLNIQGSLSTSLPNPNTKGEAFVDDMEGNRETNSISLSRSQWLWAGLPVGRDSAVASHARIEWYNPNNVQEQDLKPVLKKEEGGESTRQVLELNVKPPTWETLIAPEDWSGVTHPLATVGQDLTHTQYVEIWVNDFRSDHTMTRGTLHLDFGRVSEDAYWDRHHPPNQRLDTEDKNNDGILDRPSRDHLPPEEYLARYEDTGLDGLLDEQEGTGPDPNQDNYAYTAPSTDYSTINNTEGNHVQDPVNARPDTEDLDRDGRFDNENHYFETSLDLSDTHFVAIDVPKLYAGHPVVVDNKDGNGWRLFRIPIADSTFTRFGNASWNDVQAVRIWVDGMTEPLKLQIGGIDLVGSRWLRQAIRDSSLEDRIRFEVRARNNKDDAGIYTPPYAVESQVGSTADRREQSLALAYANFADGDSAFAFKLYGDAGGGSGWALYQEVRFWVHGDLGVESQNLRAVARFGPDTLNYYEYSVPVRSGWRQVVIPMTRLSSLKEGRDSIIVVDRVTGAATGEVYAVVRNPSFTRIGRISFGLTVDGTPASPVAGEVWIDDLRLSDVRKDKGFTSNVTVQADFADLLSLNVAYSRQDQDFFRAGQGGNQGSGFDRTSLQLSNTLHLDRFLPTSGIDLPVSFALQHSSDVPKFRTGSDVILDEARSDVETRESNRQSISASYRRSAARKGIARYTLDAISGQVIYARQGSINPQASDSSWSFSSNVSYNIPIGGDGVTLGPLKINPIPRTLNLNADWLSTRNVGYARTLTDTADVLQPRADLKQRRLNMKMETSFEPLSSIRLRYNLTSTRDMLLHQQGFFGRNKGTEIRHAQTVDVSYKPRWLSAFQPDFRMIGSYDEDASPERRQPTDPTNLKDIHNSGSARASLTLPVTRLLGRRTAGRDTSGFSAITPFRFLLSRLQDVQTSFDFTRSTTMTRVIGDPGLAFKTGFTEMFDSDIRARGTSSRSSSRRYSGRGNTTVKPFQSLNVDIRGDFRLDLSDQVYYGPRRNLETIWPDIALRWSDMHRLLGIGGTMSSLALSSGYNVRTSETGPQDALFEQRTHTVSYNPLLGWEGVFKSGVRLSVRTIMSGTEDLDRRFSNQSRERTSLSTTAQVNKVFPASKGLKLPFSAKRLRLPNDLNLGLTLTTRADKSILHQRGGAELLEADNAGWDLKSSTNYNFSQSIAGSFDLEFRQSTNRKLDVTRRGMTLGFTGSFRF